MRLLFEKYHALGTTLNDHICNALEIPTSAISSYLPEDSVTFQSGLWSHSLATKTRADDGPLEVHEHHDMDSFITLMIQSRPGLQAKNRKGKWVDIPYVRGGVICTIGLYPFLFCVRNSHRSVVIGMQLMRLTGGRFVETPYRINPSSLDQNRFVRLIT